MTVEIEEATRKEVAVFLPDIMRNALQSYRDFMERGPEAEDVEESNFKSGTRKRPPHQKSFVDHHSAGKVALAHVELLIKLAKWANVDTGMSRAESLSLMKLAKDSANAEREKQFPANGAGHDGDD